MRVVPTRMLCKVMQAGPGSGVYKIFLYDDIKSKSYGWFSTMDAETSAKKIAAKLEEIPDGTTIELHINSNGGEAKEGVAIYNSLVNKNAKKIAYIDGVAYSAAFLPALACDKIIMGLGTTALVHNMWAIVQGNAADLRKEADTLDKMMAANRGIFMTRYKGTEEELMELMESEEILTPKECVALGFADEIRKLQKVDPEELEEDPEEDPDEEPDEVPEDTEEPDDTDDPDDGAGDPDDQTDQDDKDDKQERQQRAENTARFLKAFM